MVELGRGPARDAIIADKYRVESTLGFGGMGVVIAARHLQLDERVAIKLLRDDVQLDADNVERFLREAQAAVRLKSEHVARIQDVGTLPDGKPFMVMELLEGLDLGRLLQDQGQLARPVAVDIVLQACDAIAEAHSIGIIHRDIKPTNLFITQRRDGSPLVKVLDFGISKAQTTAQLSLTQTSSMLGTPAYMSPEQMRSARNAEARSDLWSLGTVLYELVEGSAPFAAASFAELCIAVATDNPRSMTHAPELQPILEIALAKSPDDRFPSIAELALALEPFTSDPTRARRQVARIFRLLGKQPPAGRDATPTPTQPHRDSASQLPRSTTFSDEAATVRATSDFATQRRRSAWLYALLVLVLAASSSVAVIVATSGNHDEPATVKMNATAPVLPAAPAAPAGSASPTGSATTTTLDATVPHEVPPALPPQQHPTHPPAVHHAPHPLPPQPKCDPFAYPKGCSTKKPDTLQRP
jgi:serine/threonine-protein kinase